MIVPTSAKVGYAGIFQQKAELIEFGFFYAPSAVGSVTRLEFPIDSILPHVGLNDL